MKTIKKNDIMHINFLKKEPFSGSSEGMRYRMAKVTYQEPDTELIARIRAGEAKPPINKKTGEEILEPVKERNVLGVWVWPEPFDFQTTPEERKEYQEFSFSEDGVMEGLAWLNEMKMGKDWSSLSYSWKDWKEIKG